MPSDITVGVLLIAFGVILSIEQYITSALISKFRQYLPLVEGRTGYRAYTTLLPLTFTCYLFNVTNPDEVMRGENPNLVEHGPYVYDEDIQRYVQDINEETDEITYITRTMYTFNRRRSVNVSSREKITILNPAYVGTIVTLSTLPSNFMEKYGNHIPKLFANRSSIFMKARATDILFNGVKITCNPDKFPELSLICKTMHSQRPPVLRETDKEGVYMLSMFQKVNDTPRGPYSVNRGLKNLSRLGDITSYMGERVLTLWNSEACNTVRGTDAITWSPLFKPVSFVSTFSPEYCRSLEVDYDTDVIIHGIKGSKFSMQERVWFLNNSQCYCPVKDNKVECLQQGLHDTSECQKVPIIVSEPHFLHADPNLLTYARGLKPNVKLHSTYVIIEPTTGFPLGGRKSSQLNVKLSRHPVDLLANVSEGIFPLLWCSSGTTSTLEVASFPYQLLRLLQLATFLQQLPVVVGVYMVLVGLFLYSGTRRKVEPTQSVAESILISSNLQLYNGSRRLPRRNVHVFERFQRVYPAT
ncbi:sensory neuron membrane protein 2 isoform X2 [Lasioglossum baleicum]|uniref:sensory neuron membrane protein 2 isoform X2 n=1 Tax=Lasioglossum baleicum TaxID=434251 RepID=UPI003FCCC35C